MFLPSADSSGRYCSGGALQPRSAAVATAMRSKLRELDPGLPALKSDLEHTVERRAVSFAHGDGGAGRAGRDGRHAVDHRHLRHGGVLGEQAAAGVGHSHCAGRAAEGSIADRAGTAVPKLLALVRRQGLALGFWPRKVLAFIVYQATPRDPLVLAGVVWPCCCWGCWRRGFRRSARCR
jgi:hypothetical protein